MKRTSRFAAPPEPRPAWVKQLAIGAGVLLGVILLGAIIAEVLVSGSGPSKRAQIAGLDPAGIGEVVLSPDLTPEPLDEAPVIASRSAGLRLVGFEEVDEVVTEDGRRKPPEGGRLIAFELDDGPCEAEPCESWRTLEPQVEVAGRLRALPEGGDRFVVVVPPGLSETILTLDADGFEQSVSLEDGSLGESNIDLLLRPPAERVVRVGQRFQLGARSSIALQGGAGAGNDEFVRDVVVGDLELHFFLGESTPAGPGRAFLVVKTAYSAPGAADSFAFETSELAFIGRNGTRFPAQDLDPTPGIATLGFDVPASTRVGTLAFGGTSDQTSTSGIPYTITLAPHDIPVAFADSP